MSTMLICLFKILYLMKQIKEQWHVHLNIAIQGGPKCIEKLFRWIT